MINRLFAYIGEDGMKHIIVSSLLCAIFNLVTCAFGAAFVTFFIGVFKEAYDKVSGEGVSEWKDIICNTIGIAIATIATL